MFFGRLLTASVLAWLLAVAPATPADIETLEIATKSGVHVFAVEMARTDAERAKGLMYRKELPEGRGMLFGFEREQDTAFLESLADRRHTKRKRFDIEALRVRAIRAACRKLMVGFLDPNTGEFPVRFFVDRRSEKPGGIELTDDFLCA